MAEFLTLMEDWKGFRSARSALIDEAALAAALSLINNEDGYSTRRHAAMVEEAVGTSDFPTLFGVLVDREIMANYKASIPDWRSYIKVGSVPNFNEHEKHKVVGQDNELEQVAEHESYPEEPSVTGHYHRRVYKYGRKFGISWESVINDSMSAFDDIATRFLTAVQRTEARHATQTFVSSSGPHASLFGATITDVDGQNVTNLGNLAFSISNLETTLRLMSEQTDVNGEPISVEGVHLVVPPALYLDARAALTSSWKQQVDTVGGANASTPVYLPLPTNNVLPELPLQLHKNTMLPVVDTSGNKNGTWYVFADYNQGISVGFDYLRGHEAPQVCMKANNKVVLSGGAASALDGDFEHDENAYRVRTCHGGWRGDPRYCYAQAHS